MKPSNERSHEVLPDAMTRSTLHELLGAGLAWPAEYSEGLSNHLPMALHALDRLGADGQRLRQFVLGYTERFASPTPGGSVAPLSDWLPHRGRYDSLAALQATFAEALDRDAPRTVLSRTVPHLVSGVGAAAFHGLLRAAHAFEAGHGGELAHGLAYWAARWLPLAKPQGGGVPLEFDAWAARLVEQAAGWSSGERLIFLRMQAAQHASPYQSLAGRLAHRPDTLARLAAFAADAYADTGNFTVLHLVTGLRAARVLTPFFGDIPAATDSLVCAFTAAYMASGAADAPALPPAQPASWPDAIAAAIASGDEHLIKLVDACVEESAVHGEGRYLRAASRALA